MGDEIQLMQGGVREWVQQTARRASSGLRTASPTVLLSLFCAGAFGPLLMVGGAVGAGIAVFSSVGSGVLTEVVTDALNRLRQHGQPQTPSRNDLERGIAEEIQKILADGDQRADALRSEIASVLKEIDAGGTALRAAMEETNERVRRDVIAAIGVLGSDFTEMGFLLQDVAQAAAQIQKSLDVQGADVRTIIEQNERQSADIGLVREDLAVMAGRTATGTPAVAGQGDGGAKWVRGCPYRGLLSFDESDAEVFYGRERLTAELAVKLAARVTRGGLVVVTGASGAGKSSLLRAGLLPLLGRGQQVRGSDWWPRIVMTPTKDPLTELAARLAALGGGDTVSIREGLVQHPDQGHLSVWSAVLAVSARHSEAPLVAADKTDRLVLIVDQFEQIFTLNSGPDGETARQAFITALCAAATNPVGPRQEAPALVIIAVRGDFWDRCAAFPALKGALQDGQFIVGPMTESELRVAITGPADAAGLHIDAALTDVILSDLHAVGGDNTSGVLPLLSQAMSLTWGKREGNRLTNHGYAQAGGVSHAVQTGANSVYDALPAGQQTLTRDLFRSMTVASRDGRLTRRPVTRKDLYSGLPKAAGSDIDAILDGFASERLIVLDGDTAQISHDVLLRAWPQLRGWLEEDQASWILYGQLADAATAWRDSENDSSFLYRGTPLTALQQAMTRWAENPVRYPALTGIEREFLHASERAVARSNRQRRVAATILALLTLVTSIAFIVAVQARNSAVNQRNQAIYNQVVAYALQFGTSDAPLAAQLNLAAYRMQPTQDLASRLLSTENTPMSFPLGSGSILSTLALSPDGHTLASGNYDGTVRLWDVTDPAHPRQLGQPLTNGNGGTVSSIAFSPGGHTLASGNGNGTVGLWDVTDPEHPRQLGQPLINGSKVFSVAFSPDGHTLASGNDDGTIGLWDVTDPAHPRQLGQPTTNGTGYSVRSVAFSPDGHTLASGNDDGTILLWNVTDPAHPRTVGRQVTNGNTYGVQTVAFSPDGRTLASGVVDGTTLLWNVTNPAHPRQLGQPLTSASGSAVNVLAFSPVKHMLASGNYDGTVRLWDVTDPAHPLPLDQPLTNGNATSVAGVAFSPDGDVLVTGSTAGAMWLWSLPQTVLTSGSGSSGDAMVFSPARHILASGTNNGTIGLWNVADPAHPLPLGQPLTSGSGKVLSVAFSPDGHTLASGNDDGTIGLWDVTDPAHPRPLGQPLISSSSGVFSVAFSPDGHTLASSNYYDDTIQLWDVTNPVHSRPLGQPLSTGDGNTVYPVAFSPDGHTLASGNYDGTVRLWNVTDPAHPRPLGQRLITGSSGEVYSIAFSPDGHTLASGNYDGTVRLWDVTDPAHPRQLGQPLTNGNGGSVFSIAFSSNRHTLASGNANGTVGLWDVTDPPHPLPIGQPLTNGSTGSAVYRVAFSPDGHTLASGDSNGVTRLWNLNVHDAIERICATAGGLTLRQWHDYISQLQYQALCVSLGGDVRIPRARAVERSPRAPGEIANRLND